MRQGLMQDNFHFLNGIIGVFFNALIDAARYSLCKSIDKVQQFNRYFGIYFVKFNV